MSASNDLEAKKQRLSELREEVRLLEQEIVRAGSERPWRATGFYSDYHATGGFMLGIFGAITSLLVNVLGAPLVGKHPLELIRIYLTFPFGENALALTPGSEGAHVISDGMILTAGCCLYLATGMLMGIPFQLILTRFAAQASLVVRLIWSSVLATAVWLIAFYGVLSWLQPALFGGNWITDSAILPWWVAWGTHLVFGWTMALVFPLGQYRPYVSPTEQTAPA